MDDFDVLSDRELLKKLKEFNIEAGPITSTTRQLYLRKLNDVVNSNKALQAELESPVPENKRITMPGSAERKMNSPAPGNRTYKMDTPKSDPNVSRSNSNYASFMDDSAYYQTPQKNFQRNVRATYMYNHTDSPGHTPFAARSSRVLDITDESPIRCLNLDSSEMSEKDKLESTLGEEKRSGDFLIYMYLGSFVSMALAAVICYFLFGLEDKNRLSRPTIVENISRCVTSSLDRAQYLYHCELPGSNNYGQMSGSDLYYNCKESVKLGFNNYEHFIGKVIEVSESLGIKCFDANHTKESCTPDSQYFGRGVRAQDLLYCFVYTACQSVFSIEFAILVLLLGLLCYIAYGRLLKWLLYRDSGTKKMKEAALILLRRHRVLYDKGYSVTPYLPISFVRDSLIEYNQRSSMARRWECVEKMISNEPEVVGSKIKLLDVNCDCWAVESSVGYLDYAYQATFLGMKRWFPGLNTVPLRSLMRNKIPQAPTQYIKLANAHSGYLEIAHEWGDKLKEAILERCALIGAQVKHLFVLSASENRSVYVLAMNTDSATKILNAFDGAFIDGCIIETKCISGNRYFSRFPAASSARKPLAPSGKYPTSIY